MQADWQEFEELSDEKLVTALAMYCRIDDGMLTLSMATQVRAMAFSRS